MATEKVKINLDDEVVSFVVRVRRGKLNGCYNLAVETAKVLRKLIAHGKWHEVGDLLTLIHSEGRRLALAEPRHHVIANMVRRVLRLIRDEHSSSIGEPALTERQDSATARTLLFGGGKPSSPQTSTKSAAGGKIPEIPVAALKLPPTLRVSLIEILNEYLLEMETCREITAAFAAEQIQPDDVIMTIGQSETVRETLKLASKKKKIQVVVVSTSGLVDKAEAFATLLRSDLRNSTVSVIPMSAAYATMPTIKRVLMGALSVFPDGSIPVLVATPFYKITPTLHLDEASLNQFGGPEGILPLSEGSIVKEVHIYNPLFDRVPASLITLYITNMINGNSPSYVYRLANELYSAEDEVL